MAVGERFAMPTEMVTEDLPDPERVRRFNRETDWRRIPRVRPFQGRKRFDAFPGALPPAIEFHAFSVKNGPSSA
jgi:hypothetical protein